MRAGPRATPWPAPAGSSPSTEPPGWASHAWSMTPSRPRRPPAVLQRLVAAGRAVRCVEHLPDAARPAADAARRRPAPPARSWARPSSPALQRWAPDLLPMALAARRRRPGRRALHAGGRPDRPAVPRRPGGRRRHRRCSDAWLPGPLVVVVEEAHWADGASVAPARPARVRARRAGPGRSSWYGAGETGGFAPASGVRVVTCDPLPRGGDRAPRPRRHRGHPAAPARGRRHRRRAPRATRSSSRRSPGSPWASGSLGAAARVRARGDEHPDRPSSPPRRGGSCASARCSAAASVGRCSSRHPGGRRPRARPDDARGARLLHRGRRRGPAPVPQQPGSRRGLRGPGLPGARHGSTGWPARCSRTSAPTSTPTRPPSRCTSREPATLRVPGATPRWPERSRERSYANADAARPPRERASTSAGGVPGVTDADRAALWTRIGDLRELAGMFDRVGGGLPTRRAAAARRTRWPRRGARAQADRPHLRTGELATAAASRGPGAPAARRRRTTPRRAAPWCGSTASRRASRVEQERPREARRSGRSRRHGGGRRRRRPETLVRALMLLDIVEIQHGRARPRSATPRGARDLHRRARAARSRRSTGAIEPRDAGLLRRSLDRGRAVVPDEPRGRDGGRQRLRRRPDRRQPRRAPDQPGSRRRGARSCSSMPCASCAPRAPRCSSPRAEMQLARVRPQPRRPRRGRGAAGRRPPDGSRAGQRDQRPGGSAGPGGGHDPRRAEREEALAIIDAAERAASTEAASLHAAHLPPARPGAAGAGPVRGGRGARHHGHPRCARAGAALRGGTAAARAQPRQATPGRRHRGAA